MKLCFIGLLILSVTACMHQPNTQKQALSNENIDTESSSLTSKIAITFPKSGEGLVKGETYALRWTGGDSTVTIFLIDSSMETNGVSVSIADRIYGVENRGIYEYTIPNRLDDGSYKFEIGTAKSAYFKVISP